MDKQYYTSELDENGDNIPNFEAKYEQADDKRDMQWDKDNL